MIAKQKKLAILSTAVLSAFTFVQSAGAMGIVEVDGVMDGMDDYSVASGGGSFTTTWYNGHKTEDSIYGTEANPLGTTTVHYTTDNTRLYLYMEVPLYAKNMIWGNGVTAQDIEDYERQWLGHHNGTLNLDYKTATGSEQAIYSATFSDGIGGAYTGHLQGDSSGRGVDQYATSLDWLLANNVCDTTNCAASTTTMSFEWGLNYNAFPSFDPDEVIQGLMDNGIEFHMSPERGNSNVVPIPAAVWLLGSALGGLAMMRRRKTA